MNRAPWITNIIPVFTISGIGIICWYLIAFFLNMHEIRPKTGEVSLLQMFYETMNQTRPTLPAPHQIVADLWESISKWKLSSPKNILYHTWITAGSALLGSMIGTLFGLFLAILIVHSKTLDKALLPWIVISQTIPILAIAPIIIIVLGGIGIVGLVPKVFIAMYLCFFPITIGALQGLKSPQKLQFELMHTYAASSLSTLFLLRIPACLPYLFSSLKIAIASGLVGTIVAELPTGAQAGLGAKLLTASYYGNVVQLWSVLTMASLLGVLLVALVNIIEKLVVRKKYL